MCLNFVMVEPNEIFITMKAFQTTVYIYIYIYRCPPDLQEITDNYKLKLLHHVSPEITDAITFCKFTLRLNT